MRLTRETAVPREEGSKQVTFRGERVGWGLLLSCSWAGVCAARVAGASAGHCGLSAATSFISVLAGWEIGGSEQHLGPGSARDAGPQPLLTGCLSRGPTPLLGPFCESNVITDGNSAFAFYLGLRGAGSFIRFLRHQAEAEGWVIFLSSPFDPSGISVRP